MRLATGPRGAVEVGSLAFELSCPAGPFSVEGKLVSVCWELQARWEQEGGSPGAAQTLPVRVLPGPCEAPLLGPGQRSALTAGFYLPAGVRTRGALFALFSLMPLVPVLMAPFTPLPRVFVWGATAVLGVMLGGVFLIFGVPRWRRRFCREVSVALANGAELETGAQVECRVAFVPGREGVPREVSTAWLLEEYAHQQRRGEGTSRTHLVETLSGFTPCETEGVPWRRREPVLLRVPVTVPDEPSFQGSANERSWALLVRGRADGDGEWTYPLPVTVRPPRPRT
ncbi:MAG: hypothetical protein FJ086_17000 [Deltaproteobacteria bacterium]|nr:hypothetical protein [Deltaproteobacteria bacterium]